MLMLALLTAGLVLTTTAHAEPPAPEAPTMESHYAAGKAALKAGDQAGALHQFKKALALADTDERGTWQMLLAIAVTYQRMDKPGFAVEYYQRFLKRSDEYQDALTVKWSKRREMAETDIAALETRTKATHGFVTVVSEPPGAAIFLGDVQAGADRDARTTFGMYLRAGSYEVTLKLAGYRKVTRTAKVAEGKLVALRVALEPLEPTSTARERPSAATTEPGVAAEFAPEGDVNLGPWITIGVGGALTIAGVVLGILAGGARSDWSDARSSYVPTTVGDPDAAIALAANYAEDQALADKTASYETTTGVMAGLAVSAAVGGLVWLLLDGSSEAVETAEVPRLMLTPTPHGVHGHATWRF